MKAAIKKIGLPRIIASAAVMAIIIGLIARPSVYIKSVSDGLLIWATTVLPASFPFFFLTKLLTELGCVGGVSRLFRRPCRALYNVPGIAGYIYFMSILSGYPVGAKLTLDLYEKGCINSFEASRISTFTSTSGPLFVIGSVGVGMFASYKIGLILLVSHILAAALNGLIYRFYKRKEPVSAAAAPEQSLAPVDEILSKTVYSSILSILTVGAYIAIFFMLISMLSDTKLLYPLEFVCSKIVGFLGAPEAMGAAIAKGFIEVTRGCIELAPFAAGFPVYTTVAAALLLSFGGLCIHLQALTYLSKAHVKIWFFAASKLTHAVLTALLAWGLAALLL